jgi:monovalent cation:proton antiporter-2 (CPA2) family protein
MADESILSDIIILLTAAVIIVPLFQYWRLGAVPGFLLAGLLIGPAGLGFIENVTQITHFAEFGVVFLLFIIGIELKPSRLWLMRHTVFGLGSLQVVITGGLLMGILMWWLDMPLQTALLIGPALALSSTAFGLQLLNERRALGSERGRTSFAILLFQDISVVPLLALVPVLAQPEIASGGDILFALGKAALIVFGIIFAGRYLLQPALKNIWQHGTPEIFTACAILLVLAAAAAMLSIGLSMAFGAFLAGLLIADSPFRHQVIAEIQPFRGLLLGLFFMSMGMSVDLLHLAQQPLQWLGIVIALMAFKAAVMWPLVCSFKLHSRDALAVSLLLAQSGEFALALFAVAFGAGLLPEILFRQLLLVVLLSMMLTPLLARLADRIARGKPAEPDGVAKVTDGTQDHQPPIILAGFGRMGQRIGSVLEAAGIAYVAVEKDAELVTRQRELGRPVFLGDSARSEVLRAAGAAAAKIVVITLNDPEAIRRIVAVISRGFPDLGIFARGHDLSTCKSLRALGAHVTVSETLEASLELARAALVRVGTQQEHIDQLMEQSRREFYEPLNIPLAERKAE